MTVPTPAAPAFADASHAPFVFFDNVPAHGIMEGVVTLTLSAQAMLPSPARTGIDIRHLAVAYLRCNRRAAMASRRAIDGAAVRRSPETASGKTCAPETGTEAARATVGAAFSDAAHAPFVFFDTVPAYGTMEGLVTITLCAQAMLPAEDGHRVDVRHLAVAYLRCNGDAATALGRAIDNALLMGAKVQGGRNRRAPSPTTMPPGPAWSRLARAGRAAR